MTVLKTSMRNFFAHKGRMALSAIAVLLSVAFVCGTLVFTDTTNATFDQLFASTSSDVSVKPKEKGGSHNGPQTGKIETVPGTRLAELKKVQGVKSVAGEISTETVTVVRCPDRRHQLGPDRAAGGGPHLRP